MLYLQSKGKCMKINSIKAKGITKLLTLLGFTSAAFVFTACYGARPVNYSEKLADSLSLAVNPEEPDSIQAAQSTENAQGNRAADAR